jgi:hypothetical protein
MGIGLKARTAAGFRAGQSQRACGCQRRARLAHPLRVRPSADPHGPAVVGQGAARRRPERDGLRTGLDHHRPVSVAVSLGAVSPDQGGSETAYAARSAWSHPHERARSGTTFDTAQTMATMLIKLRDVTVVEPVGLICGPDASFRNGVVDIMIPVQSEPHPRYSARGGATPISPDAPNPSCAIRQEVSSAMRSLSQARKSGPAKW